MTEMEERVAKAMLADLKRQSRDDHTGAYVDGHDNRLHRVLVDGTIDLLEFARATILAMREPTEAMVDAGHERTKDPMGNMHEAMGIGKANARSAWRAMIDKALEEAT